MKSVASCCALVLQYVYKNWQLTDLVQFRGWVPLAKSTRRSRSRTTVRYSDSHKQGAYFSHSSHLDRSLLVFCVVQVQELALLVAKLEYRNTVRRSPEATKCEHTASVAAGW